jgi:carotenoid cleavage dioxygenase
MDLPVVFDVERALQGTLPYAWSETYGARLGVMPRGGSNADVRWFEIEPCYVFHPLNAWAAGHEVVLDVARYPHMWRESATDFARAALHRFRIDLAGDRVREEPLDDAGIEFPRVDPRREGQRNRWGYAVSFAEGVDGPRTDGLIQYDLERASSVRHDFGPGRSPGEAVFAPASAASGECEGYAIALVHDEARDTSELAILDATAFDKPPVATVALPQRVPYGFHGSWIPDAS